MSEFEKEIRNRIATVSKKMEGILMTALQLAKQWRAKVEATPPPIGEHPWKVREEKGPSPLEQVFPQLCECELEVFGIFFDALSCTDELSPQTIERIRILEPLFELTRDKIRVGDTELLMDEWREVWSAQERLAERQRPAPKP